MEKIVFSELSALVGTNVYPLVSPEKKTAPYIIYTRVAVTPENTLDGGSTIDLQRIQIDIYADTYAQTKTLAAAVRSNLEGGSGKGTLQSEIDLFEPDLRIYRISQDYYFWKRGQR